VCVTVFKVFLRSQVDEIRQAVGQGSEFSIVGRLLNKEARGAVMSVDESDGLSLFIGDALQERTSEEKVAFLTDYRAAAARIDEMLAALASSDVASVASALSVFVQLFTIQDVFSTPLERRAVAPEIVGLFEMSLTSPLLPLLVKFTEALVPAQIQRDAAVVIFFVAIGVRIANVPEESLLHPQHSLFKRALVHVGAVEALVRVARNAVTEQLKESAIRALAAIALDDVACRQYVLAVCTNSAPEHDISAFSPTGFAQGSFDSSLLVRQELDQLSRQAGLGPGELEQLYTLWGAELNSQISREQFAAGLRGVGISDPLVIEQSFSAFDADGSGHIDFREFVSGMAVLHRGSPEDRLKLMFQSYDLDKNGFLDRDEVFAIFRTALLFSGLARSSAQLEHAHLTSLVDEAFRRVDVNGDNKLDFHEFVLAVNSSVIVSDCFIKTPFA
jgi:serine/threonine-protein phosphatase 2B regulatory subunit